MEARCLAPVPTAEDAGRDWVWARMKTCGSPRGKLRSSGRAAVTRQAITVAAAARVAASG